MNIIVGSDAGTYTFNPDISGQGRIDIINVPAFKLEQIKIITNVTHGIMIYNFADPSLKGDLQNGVLYLNADTSFMSAEDRLMIVLDIAETDTFDPDDCSYDTKQLINYLGSSNANLTIWGDTAPLSQWQREQSNYDQLTSLFTYDIASEKVFGSQRLESNGKLKVLPQNEDIITSAIIGTSNAVVPVLVEGQGTIVVHISGVFTGTISFEGNSDNSNYTAVSGLSTAGNTAYVTSTTTVGIWRFPAAGLKRFQCRMSTYGSGKASVCIVQSNQPSVMQQAQVGLLGSQTQPVQQKATTYETLTYDTSSAPSLGLIKDALLNSDFWNPKGVYYIGDTVTYNNQVYQCILATGTNYYVPTNTTYWKLDQRQNKSLVTTTPLSSPTAPRLRVEIDLDAYQYRLMESSDILNRISTQNQLISNDQLLFMSSGRSLGQVSSSAYTFEEVR